SRATPACSSRSTSGSRPARRSFWSPARSISVRCCSAAWAVWCGSSSPAATSRHDDEAQSAKEDAMLTRRQALAATALAALFVAPCARAQDRLNVIASFSILGDFVKNVGGDRVEVATLVGPNGNAHVYAPSPGDAKKVADAKLVFVNGLGFEGWLERLVKASGTKAPIVVATKGIKPLERAGEHGHDHDHGRADPHAWQSVANAKIYVANIRDALIAPDPAGKDASLANAAAYLAKLDALERDVREVVAKIPPDRRRVITSHSAFGYFQNAYGVSFTAPQGVSTETEASAKDVAAIIAQIKKQ